MPSEPATVTLTISLANRAPVAADDDLSTSEDTPLEIDVSALLANDGDPENDDLIIRLVTDATHGTVDVANVDNGLVYTPNQDFHGTDSFTYEVFDGELASDIATVTITVSPVNDVPVAIDDEFEVALGNSLTIGIRTDLLGNDIDVDGDVLNAVLVGAPRNGSLAFDGDFIYSPDPNFQGTDTFTYMAKDAVSSSNIAHGFYHGSATERSSGSRE